MANINLETSEIVGLLLNRLTDYTDDETVASLFGQYWENMIEAGCFSGGHEFTVSEIVDNDYSNCTIIRKGDKYWDACTIAHDNGVNEVCDNDPDDYDSEDNIIYMLKASEFDENGDLAFLVIDY